jgi:hypothetical protein
MVKFMILNKDGKVKNTFSLGWRLLQSGSHPPRSPGATLMRWPRRARGGWRTGEPATIEQGRLWLDVGRGGRGGGYPRVGLVAVK